MHRSSHRQLLAILGPNAAPELISAGQCGGARPDPLVAPAPTSKSETGASLQLRALSAHVPAESHGRSELGVGRMSVPWALCSVGKPVWGVPGRSPADSPIDLLRAPDGVDPHVFPRVSLAIGRLQSCPIRYAQLPAHRLQTFLPQAQPLAHSGSAQAVVSAAVAMLSPCRELRDEQPQVAMGAMGVAEGSATARRF